jgi:hypothetical protein
MRNHLLQFLFETAQGGVDGVFHSAIIAGVVAFYADPQIPSANKLEGSGCLADWMGNRFHQLVHSLYQLAKNARMFTGVSPRIQASLLRLSIQRSHLFHRSMDGGYTPQHGVLLGERQGLRVEASPAAGFGGLLYRTVVLGQLIQGVRQSANFIFPRQSDSGVCLTLHNPLHGFLQLPKRPYNKKACDANNPDAIPSRRPSVTSACFSGEGLRKAEASGRGMPPQLPRTERGRRQASSAWILGRKASKQSVSSDHQTLIPIKIPNSKTAHPQHPFRPQFLMQ